MGSLGSVDGYGKYSAQILLIAQGQGGAWRTLRHATPAFHYQTCHTCSESKGKYLEVRGP